MRVKSIVLGVGEIGQALLNILQEKYGEDQILGYDQRKKKYKTRPNVTVEILNICIPYSELFITIVKTFQRIFKPKLTIIHSTVPIGTTRKIKNAVHSPVLGQHTQMEQDIKTYDKWIGGSKRLTAKADLFFNKAGIFSYTVIGSEKTEVLKLLCLAKYGVALAFQKYQQKVTKQYGINYSTLLEWDRNYNSNISRNLRRPIFPTLFDKTIGGHCVVSNTIQLNRQHPNQMLREVLKYTDNLQKGMETNI